MQIESIRAKSAIPRSALEELFQAFKHNHNVISDAIAQGRYKTYTTASRQVGKYYPCVKMIAVFYDYITKTEIKVECTEFPKKRYGNKKRYRLEYVLYWVDLEDIIKFHTKIHPQNDPETVLDFSIDGVPETKSGGFSFEVLSMHFFNTCRLVYPVLIAKRYHKFAKIDLEDILGTFIRQLNESDLTHRLIVADAPKRSGMFIEYGPNVV